MAELGSVLEGSRLRVRRSAVDWVGPSAVSPWVSELVPQKRIKHPSSKTNIYRSLEKNRESLVGSQVGHIRGLVAW